jgi:hypothetical protein
MKRGLILAFMIAGLIALAPFRLLQADPLNAHRHDLWAVGNPTAPAQTVSYTFAKIADTTGPLSAFNCTPSINNNGTVAFVADLRAGGSGIFRGSGGLLTRIIDPTTSVGDLGTPVRFDCNIPAAPSINDAGTVVFNALLTSGRFGIFTGDGGTINAVALNSLDPNANPQFFSHPSIDNAGRVYMLGQSQVAVGKGIYVHSGATTNLLYDEFILESQGFPRGLVNNFSGPASNQIGTVAFAVGPEIAALRFPLYIFTGSGGPVTQIVQSPGPLGDGSPLTGLLSVNNSGTVAFLTGVNQGAAGIFTGNGGSLNTIVTNNSTFPALREPAINDSGMVVFTAQLNPSGSGIFTGQDPIANKIIARGDVLQGLTIHSVFSGRFSLNNAGQIAFVAWFADGTQGVFRADPVIPNSAPVAQCLDLTVSAGSNCTAQSSVDNGSSDPDGDSITITQSPPGPYPVGTTPVTLTVTDSNGASSQCTATVTVVDISPPTITTCPSNITTTAPLRLNSVAVNYAMATATDNCHASIACAPPSGSAFPVGATTVNCTAIDEANNTAICSFSVTVRTPQQSASQLVNDVQSLVSQGALRPSQAMILITRLQVAVQLMNQGLGMVAIIQLRLFIADVNALINTGQLSQFQGEPLIAVANEIIASLGP